MVLRSQGRRLGSSGLILIPRIWTLWPQLAVIPNRCVKIEHARFFGGLNLVGMNTGVITARRSLI